MLLFIIVLLSYVIIYLSNVFVSQMLSYVYHALMEVKNVI